MTIETGREYSKEYNLIDLGLILSYLSGLIFAFGFLFFYLSKEIIGFIIIVVSFFTFMVSRFIALKSCFERDNRGE